MTNPADPAPAAGSIPVEVWVPDAAGGIDHLAARSDGPASTDADVRDALAVGRRVVDYVEREYGRRSYDGAGSTLKLRVHAPDPATNEPHANNAFWFADEQRIWLGDGDGVLFSPLGGDVDIVAHEFFHGVIDTSMRLDYVGQEGALHESFADVLGSGVEGDWMIGNTAFTPGTPGDALRDLAHLHFTDWRTFPAGEDEVHAMSEVPSQAAYLVGQKIGAREMRQVWFRAVTGTMKDHSGFAGARDATIAAAKAIYGARSAQASAVADAWAAVGIDSSTPKERLAAKPAAAAATGAASGAFLLRR